MLHIHRHVSGLTGFASLVISQKLEGIWPTDRMEVVPRSPFRFVGRAAERLTGRPWQISGDEADRIATAAAGSALLHIFFGNVAIHLLPLLRRAKMPVVISFHGADVAGSIASEPYADARKEMFSLARLVLCRSEQLAGQVAGLGCERSKLRIMKTVLPDLAFSLHAPPDDGAWQIVQAARLVPKKGIATSLRAFAGFQHLFPASRFLIAGEGPLEAGLRQLAATLGIAGSVDFCGFLPQDILREKYAKAHIFLHPSEEVHGDVEGIPNALLEAMACGLPAVATRHGGIPEVIADGVTGLLCPERDPDALAAALLRLAGDPALYRSIGQAGAATVRDQFSPARRIAEIEALYREASMP